MAALPSRRDLVRAGSLGVLGLGLSSVLGSTPPPRRAKSVILLFMWGGPSHLDTWDPKPDAPAEVRGEFGTRPTTIPGLRIGEHFPKLSTRTGRLAVIRSMAHTDVAHLSSVHHLMTGRLAPKPNSDADPPSRHDTPHVGSMLDHLKPLPPGVPGFVSLPWTVSHPAAPGGVAPGQHAGWLGAGFDPFLVSGDPNRPDFKLAGLGVQSDRTGARAELLRHLDRHVHDAGYSSAQQKAMHLLSAPDVQKAFDLSTEPPKTRDRYGRTTHGQSVLLGRRLVEAGVRLVCVNWPNDGQNFWDTHGDNFRQLKTRLMPAADAAFSALLDDLTDRGLLDETLVLWVGEFGRTPKITAGNAGREHWARCYSAVLAGGGVKGGQVYGSSDRIGAEPAEKRVSPADLTATVYHALGVDPETTVNDRLGRPLALTEGTPLQGLFTTG
ncbi:MAG: DUF1501 domain-containing protein [Fimbriiglobus sp.]|jgi:hypothetical protein|nr:DUF1501 domain-containing protein [Fimbriiglobus sp.]